MFLTLRNGLRMFRQKAKLAEAETELARQMDKLNEKRAQLQQVTDKLQALNDEFAGILAHSCCQATCTQSAYFRIFNLTITSLVVIS